MVGKVRSKTQPFDPSSATMQARRTPERARFAPSLTPQTGLEALAYRSFGPIHPAMQAPTAVACTPIIGLFALQGPDRSRHKEWKWMSISAKRTNGMPFSPFLPETEAEGRTICRSPPVVPRLDLRRLFCCNRLIHSNSPCVAREALVTPSPVSKTTKNCGRI